MADIHRQGQRKVYKLITRHARLFGNPYHEWVLSGGDYMADTEGRAVHRGSTKWLIAVCNNTVCPGRAAVSETAIIALLPTAEADRPKGRSKEPQSSRSKTQGGSK